MMKKILSIIIAVVVIITWQLLNKEQTIHSTLDPAIVPIKEELMQLQQDKKYNALTKEEQLEKTNEVLDKIPDTHQKLKRYYKMATSPLPEISFYARIIDQFDQPVVNARVWYSGENSYLSSGGGQGFAETDDDGYLMIKIFGAALELGAVNHPEIDSISYKAPTRYINSTRDKRESIIRFLQHDKNEYALNWKNYTDKNNAYIIRAHRLGEYKGAIKGKVDLNVYYSLDDSKYTLDLLGKKYKYAVKKGLHEGHMTISCTRKINMKNHRDYGDWSTTITPINGGIQETNDLYMNEAPTSGYKPSIVIDMKHGSENYEFRVLNKRYYFTANNGETYGSLFVHFKPHAKYKEPLCRVEIKNYIINPTGARSLDLKKN